MIHGARRSDDPTERRPPERDFVYIDDVVDAFVAAANFAVKHATNIRSGTGTSVRDLVTLLLGMLDAPHIAQFGSSPCGRMRSCTWRLTFQRPGADRLTPRTSLDEGLKSTIDWYKHDALHRV